MAIITSNSTPVHRESQPFEASLLLLMMTSPSFSCALRSMYSHIVDITKWNATNTPFKQGRLSQAEQPLKFGTQNNGTVVKVAGPSSFQILKVDPELLA